LGEIALNDIGGDLQVLRSMRATQRGSIVQATSGTVKSPVSSTRSVSDHEGWFELQFLGNDA
jgi:hypothetical protein